MPVRCVVVSGASAGIGRAAAVAFGRRGCRVALLARGMDGLQAACREVEQAGGRALAIPVDVADHAQVEAAAARVEQELGPIDVWVNYRFATLDCTCMDKQVQSVPPIYQPELAAEAIIWASEHRRRELWVGFSTVQAILGTRIIPGLLDRLLARKAYTGQQSDQPLPENRQDNLYRAVPGGHGVHGRFDRQAKPSSWQFRLTTHRLGVTGVAVALAVALAAALAVLAHLS